MGNVTKIGAYQYMGLSSADKPTDCEENALFLELDTAKIKYFDGEEWRELGEEIANWVTLYENDALELTYIEDESGWFALGLELDGEFLANKETIVTVDTDTLSGTSEVGNNQENQIMGETENGYVMAITMGSTSTLVAGAALSGWEGETVTASVKVMQLQ